MTDKIFALIKEERQRQDEKWGEQNHHPLQWFSIISEEHGKICQAFNHYRLTNSEEDLQQMKDKAVNVAACNVALLECLERNKAWMPQGKPETSTENKAMELGQARRILTEHRDKHQGTDLYMAICAVQQALFQLDMLLDAEARGNIIYIPDDYIPKYSGQELHVRYIPKADFRGMTFPAKARIKEVLVGEEEAEYVQVLY